MKYYQILQELAKLRAENKEKPNLKIWVLSNIIVHQLPDILDYQLRKHGIICEMVMGNYDNILQDAVNIPREDVVILFWDAANITDGLHYLVKTFSDEEITALLEKTSNELATVVNYLKNHKKVFVNSYHAYPFEAGIVPGSYASFVGKLNENSHDIIPDHFQRIDLSGIITATGMDNSFDLRNFYSSKTLYSIDFFKTYSTGMLPMIGALTGHVKKVLIVDCDNTLWDGIVGEDGKDGIKITTPYRVIQATIVELYKKGVLICLCSKNNPSDVEEVLVSHPEMILRNEHILLKKVNWENKAANIRAISIELNLGLSSFVFLDDSSFEVNLIKEQLPEVLVFQVPEKVGEYPALMEEIAYHFFRFETNKDETNKTEQYRLEEQRETAKGSFQSVDEYLRSLELSIGIEKNKEEYIPRIAQMTQKTNQFNLTTKRYSEQDVKAMMDSGNMDIYTLSVKDRYGDSGITGLSIIKHNRETAEVDTLLMSCRILGRNIEWIFMDYMIREIKTPKIKAWYLPTVKNQQVADFYNSLGFKLISSDEKKGKEFMIVVAEYQMHNKIDYINVE